MAEIRYVQEFEVFPASEMLLVGTKENKNIEGQLCSRPHVAICSEVGRKCIMLRRHRELRSELDATFYHVLLDIDTKNFAKRIGSKFE